MATVPPDPGRHDADAPRLRPRPSAIVSPELIARQTREDLRLLETLLTSRGIETGGSREFMAILTLIQRIVERNSTILEVCAERLQYLEEQVWLQR